MKCNGTDKIDKSIIERMLTTFTKAKRRSTPLLAAVRLQRRGRKSARMKRHTGSPRMSTVRAVVALSKCEEAFKEFDELLLTTIIQRLFHHHAFDLPVSTLRPQQIVPDRLRHGTLWNVMQTRKRTPCHEVAWQYCRTGLARALLRRRGPRCALLPQLA